MKETVIQHFIDCFLEPLKKETEALIPKYPSVKIQQWSSSVGGRTRYQGWDLGIDCIFLNRASIECDSVALSIGIMHADTDPKISEADVMWGERCTGEVCEVELIDSPIPWTEENIEKIEKGLPRLIDGLRNALDRQRPREKTKKTMPYNKSL